MVLTMQIGALLGTASLKATSPLLNKNAALQSAFATIASPSAKEGNKPSAAGNSPLSASMTAELLKTQEVKDETSIESQFAEMLEGSSPEEMISEISSMSGFMKWQVKELTKKITSQVMGSMGITMDDLNAMPSEQKIAVMKQIMDAVQEKLKIAMEEQMKKQNKETLPLAASNIEPTLY